MERVTSCVFVLVLGWSCKLSTYLRPFSGNQRCVVRNALQLDDLDGHCCWGKALPPRSRQQLRLVAAACCSMRKLRQNCRILNIAAVTRFHLTCEKPTLPSWVRAPHTFFNSFWRCCRIYCGGKSWIITVPK